MAYAFSPATHADLPLLRTWLATPEVQRWWGHPAEQYAILEEDLGNPLMAMRIVSVDGAPFAYVQDYALASWPQPQFNDLPEGGRGIDAFIGVPEMIGQGHGAAFLHERAAQLIGEGASLVAIDPDAQNLPARRAYAKTGFVGDEIVATAASSVVVMVFRNTTKVDRLRPSPGKRLLTKPTRSQRHTAWQAHVRSPRLALCGRGGF